MVRAVNVFVSYSHEDEPLRAELGKHLSSLRRSRAIAEWHDRKIDAGAEWAKEIDRNLKSADVILLLISPAFIHSDYCSSVELTQAMEQHEAGTACVIPIILRACDWENEPFAKLQAYPKNAKPVTSSENRDEAFLDIVRGVRGAVQRIAERLSESSTSEEVGRETDAIVQEIVESGQGEDQYREEVLFVLSQDGGEISSESRIVLEISRKSFQLSEERAKALEAEVIRPFQEFREAAIALIKPQGSVTPRIQSLLDRAQQRLNLSDADAAAIIENVLASISEPVIVVPPKPSLPTFSFEVITVNDRGQEIDRHQSQASYRREQLAKGVFLDMVAIPGGTFWMGAAEGELKAENSEKPRHQVTIEPFFMGKYAVTQAQWKVIAQLPKINRDLNPDPSQFKGNNRPVGRILWDDAIEFCDRLTRKTGELYRLPSEAEWEYACRAGTTTLFHFGETITPDLVNYNGSSTYAKAAKGKYRKTTIEVGSFPPNAFGLYDMHGNVREWCADPWHDSYTNAPADGRVWEVESDRENNLRVLRGGSWVNNPWICRSASRYDIAAGTCSDLIGFRVVCLAPRTS
ncbi:MAG: SUMF1/EgtB/PvdO family nonheme iron enzyme [Leptolyngbya sp. UWPOB_LEPTO1]|uniref:SUMF1/EgtB/PvdO family nonheme iron enzyme n=1 Tax=Leptolyngbya sp. UWPOB_LEPTO1 TaxID=2815653 RepID=UPI001AC0BA3B|nr:SUMF1/EgtB/PvdO family nonheme iron enzyme [Leptolyngbya sp. UWPOB_LEPTO1]MBN8564364.1 SUMF1/EgtB/PvdO family nonheme iron enzyme [Leptolyngbya sp. UWPOB_LEPTO1]